MIKIKNEKEIVLMREGGKILSEVLFTVIDYVKPGISELELDKLAEKLILEKGGEPGFKMVEGYHHAICVSTNDAVVHGIPTSYKLKEGDIVGIDCGVYYKGFHTDMAETVKIKNQKPCLSADRSKIKNEEKIDKFLNTGKKALEEAIRVAKIGNRIGHISKTIQSIIERDGYSVVRSLVGHGVGRKIHEEPEVPGFLTGKIEDTYLLREGMVIAIEAIYNMGSPNVVYLNNDGWSIKTKDNSLSGLFERTVAITKKGTFVLTQN